ncbi:Uma2 family endonuclease [Actinomycetes bacterium KLBMP 9759]
MATSVDPDRILLLAVPSSCAPSDRRALRGGAELSLDKRDEVWDAEVHVVPPTGEAHQDLSDEFFLVVAPLAEKRGLVPRTEGGLHRTADDYRIPDQLYRRPEHRADHGATGAELVLEIRSPRDQTSAKISFYAAMGVQEMIILHPDDRRVELLRSVEGRPVSTQPDTEGAFTSTVLGITLRSVAGKLRITWPEGSAEI